VPLYEHQPHAPSAVQEEHDVCNGQASLIAGLETGLAAGIELGTITGVAAESNFNTSKTFVLGMQPNNVPKLAVMVKGRT
jgi:hypothetical protein